MTSTLTGRDIRLAFEAPFDDPAWGRKWAAGSALLFLGTVVPVLPSLIFQGYLVGVIRSRLRGDGPALPEWGNWSEALFDGLRLWLVGFAYRLPAYLFFTLGLASVAGIPFVIQVWAERGPSAEPFWVILPFLQWAGFSAALSVAGLLAAASGFLLPAIVAHVVARNDVASAFRPGEWWPIVAARPSTYLIVFVLMGACSLALSMLAQVLSATIVLCCLVPLVVSPFRAYLGMVSSILFAFAYRSASQALGPAALDRIP